MSASAPTPEPFTPEPANPELPSLESLNAFGVGCLPGLIGVRFTHAASVIALADTTCGYGTRILLPDGAHSFTTIELKSNHLGTARDGTVTCEARNVHAGRTTQVWDAEVRAGDGKLMALFRCTQAVLYPKPAPAGE